MLRILYLVIFFIAAPVFAQQQNDLYRTEVELTDLENAESLAKKEGLINVLIKVSGQQAIASNPVIKKALAQSDRYITQMRFIANDDDGKRRGLKLTYNSKMIRSLLNQAEQSIWETPRKSVLVWVVNEDNNSRRIIWEQSNSYLVSKIKNAANERGLPIMFPVGDFEDVTSIATTDLWGNFKNPIANASKRYNPEAILVVKIRGNSSTWTLFDTAPKYLATSSQKPISDQVSGANQLADIVNQVSNYYATAYIKDFNAVASESEIISIVGIKSTDDFFAIEQQLQNMNSVANVQVDIIQGDKVTYMVNLLTDYQQFNDELLNKNPQITQIENTPVIDVNQDANGVELNDPLTLDVQPQQNDLSTVQLDNNVATSSDDTVTDPAEDVATETDQSLQTIHQYQYKANRSK